MESFGQVLDLKDDPGVVRKYVDHHGKVWPEVLDALRDIGISKMKIFLVGNHLFMYYEAPDDFVPERDFQAYTKAARAQEWDDLMRTFQQKASEAGPDDWWAPAELVFDLDW